MKNLDSEEQKEYNNFIKSSVADGSYFNDARKWYIFRYVYPICERTILFFIIIFSGLIAYCIFSSAINFLPIEQKIPIIIKAKDQSRYFPIIKKLKDSIELKNVDEAVLKYLLGNYVKQREGYDFRKNGLENIGKKLTYISNNSSKEEYNLFLNFLDRKNRESPYNYFGQDFQRIVDIKSVSFLQKEDEKNLDNLLSNFKNLLINQVPQEATIRYNLSSVINSKEFSSQEYLIKIKFKFSGVNLFKNVNPVSNNLNFLVTEYKIYKVI